MTALTIALDGPSGAGKSTIAKSLAKHLGIDYLDTGAMFRAIALAALTSGIDPRAAEAVEGLLEGDPLEVSFDQNGQHVLLSGQDVTELIRSPEVSKAASDISTLEAVRNYLLQKQRKIAASHSIILDGRDIGTVVLPQAPVKLFLTASPQERARRRYLELVSKGVQTTVAEVEKDMLYRDQQDQNRAISPLRQAEDAVLIDSTHLNAEEVVCQVLELIRERGYAC